MNPVGHAGRSAPLGATVVDGGINFSLFSRSATGVELLLFDREDDARPARVMHLDRRGRQSASRSSEVNNAYRDRF
jgi:pullulanase/glycogen debranching enzyme